MSRPQAKDISTEAFVAAVRADYTEGWVSATGQHYTHSTTWSVAQRLGLPQKVVAAKLRRLDQQGVLQGCACGCGSPIFLAERLTEP